MDNYIVFGIKSELLKVVGNREIKTVTISNHRFLLIRTGDDFYLSETLCPHMDHNLAEGSINPFGQLVCPWHSYKFDLKEGSEEADRCRNLRSYPLMEKEGKIVCPTSVLGKI